MQLKKDCDKQATAKSGVLYTYAPGSARPMLRAAASQLRRHAPLRGLCATLSLCLSAAVLLAGCAAPSSGSAPANSDAAQSATSTEGGASTSTSSAATSSVAVATHPSFVYEETGDRQYTYSYNDAGQLTSVAENSPNIESYLGHPYVSYFFYTASGMEFNGVEDIGAAPYLVTCDEQGRLQSLRYPTQNTFLYTLFDENGIPSQIWAESFQDSDKNLPNYMPMTSDTGETLDGLVFAYDYTYDEQERISSGSCTVNDGYYLIDEVHTFTCDYAAPPAAQSVEDWASENSVTVPDTFVAKQSELQTAYFFTTAEHGLVLRKGPSTEAEEITTIPYKSSITVRGVSGTVNDWSFIVYADDDAWYMGWASNEYLSDDFEKYTEMP